ncbi:hypothetical protein [Streptomyces sp. NPDC048710]|uniref:hypothetical protein n=1 Tax=Streptomyces sp. NPDC048710 TaxID=3365586 RepID=UPI00371CD650
MRATTAGTCGGAPGLILTGGQVLTADHDFTVVGGDAVMRALAGPGAQVVDLRGRTVLPGINDSARLSRSTPIGAGSSTLTRACRPPAVASSAYALRLPKAGGRPSGPEQCVPLAEALRASPVDAAWQDFADDRKDTVEPGKVAGLCVLDRPPPDLDPHDLTRSRWTSPCSTQMRCTSAEPCGGRDRASTA